MSVLVDLAVELASIVDENFRLKERVAELEAKPLDNRHKLTRHEVQDIRAAHRGGMKQKDLAINYGVNPATISRIVRGVYH